jgi:outer membrane protein insertion porin family
MERIRLLLAEGAVVGLTVAGLLIPSASGAADYGISLPTVKSIEILGNRSFSDKVLKKRMRTKEAHFYRIFRQPTYRRDFLRRDVEALDSFYHANGFLEARVRVDTVIANQRSNSVRIRIAVNEGPRTVVRHLSFAGQNSIPEPDLRRGLRLVEGEPYNPNILEVDRYTLLSKFFDRGCLGATVDYAARIDSAQVTIDWTITPREPVRVNDVRVSGVRTVKERYVRRELTFKRGDYFNTKKVLNSTQNLYDTGYFTSVEIKPESLDLDRRIVDLQVQVRERKMGYIEGGLGVGNIQGNRVSGEWGQRNLFGLGLAFYAKSSYAFQLFPNNQFALGKIDFRSKFMRHDGQLVFPHVVGTWNTFSVGAFYARDATIEPIIVKDRGFTAQLSRRFSRQSSLVGVYSLERVQRLEVEEEKLRSRLRAIDLTFTRDTRDFYFNPQRGMYVTVEGRYTGGVLGGEDDSYSLVGSVQRYARVPGNTVFAYRLQSGYADVFGRSKATGLPIERRFFAGGGNSVRGYKENSLGPVTATGEPLGGRILLLTTVELRFPLPLISRFNFGGAVFLDGGNVWNSAKEIGIRDFRLTANTEDMTRKDYMYGAGFGLRYYTPVGPIRLDIGFPLKETADMDYHYWVHISLGQIF